MKEGLGENMARSTPHIASIGVATPDHTVSQQEAVTFLLKHYDERLSRRSRKIVQKIFAHPSILKRKFALPHLECLIDEDPDERIARYTHWAVELASQAIDNALSQAFISPDEISALVVNTCTGYICPGLSTYLIQRLGLPSHVLAFDLVGSGCGGAIPNLQLAESLLKTNGQGAVLSVSVEICSATFQMADELGLIVSNAIFADGASAAVLANRPGGWQLVASANRTAPDFRDAIRYVHRNGQLHNQLADNLPALVNKFATQVVTDILEPRSLSVKDVTYWALHPGGDKIVNAVKEGLNLDEVQLGPTRSILSQYGNMSSPTVMFVLQELSKNDIEQGELCLLVAFGAGLTAHGLLLKKN